MLREKFETWPADFFPNAILVLVGIYVINLSYLEDRSLYITELPNDNIEESQRMLVGLDVAAIIPKTDNQNLPDLIDSIAKWVNKKKEKAKRRWQRKIYLAQATATSGTPLSWVVSACCPTLSLVASTGGANNASTDGTLSSPVADGPLLSTVSS